jgi:hypothetical protein
MTDTTDKALDARIIRANPIAGMDAAPDGRWVSYEALIDLRRECDALRAQLATARADAVRVKPLAWEGDAVKGWFARGVARHYQVFKLAVGEDYGAVGVLVTDPDPQIVMAAVEADNLSRILAALEPAPSAPSPEAVARAALEDAVAEALYALSWAKANLADYSFQIGEGRKDFPVLDRALARAHAAIVAKAGGGE